MTFVIRGSMIAQTDSDQRWAKIYSTSHFAMLSCRWKEECGKVCSNSDSDRRASSTVLPYNLRSRRDRQQLLWIIIVQFRRNGDQWEISFYPSYHNVHETSKWLGQSITLSFVLSFSISTLLLLCIFVQIAAQRLSSSAIGSPHHNANETCKWLE